MALIEIDDFSYQYPVSDDFALKNITFSIEQGDFVGVIGPNGSGKTTLCNAIRGFVPSFYKGVSFGQILFEGKDLSKISSGELAVRIGYIFQNPFNQISYIKDTVFEELCFGLENLGVEPSEIIRRVEAIIDELGIGYLKDKNPFEISGGQQQRVALASILVMDPDVLVIDEPTSQLDPVGTEQVFAIIDLVKQKGKTVVLVEHKIDLVAEYADKIIVMDKGRIAFSGPTREILSDERLLDHDTQIPIYARIGHRLRKAGKPVERIPITHEETVDLLRDLMNHK